MGKELVKLQKLEGLNCTPGPIGMVYWTDNSTERQVMPVYCHPAALWLFL
jgi:hypothetical protein